MVQTNALEYCPTPSRPEKFGLVFVLRGHGWARILMYQGDRVVDFGASYLSDSPREFLEAVLLLTEAETGLCTISVCFPVEPGAYWLLARRNNKQLKLNVYWDSQEEAESDDLPRLVSTYGSIFEAELPCKEFARHVYWEFEDILRAWGKTRYAKDWDAPWPEEAFVELKMRVMRWNKELLPEG